jgi:membrane associated rhomboid family serine protease
VHPDLQSPATLIILAVTAVVSILAFRDHRLWDRLMLKPREILADKQYERLLTSGFVHGDGFHLAFNAYSLLACGRDIEAIYGIKTLLLVYFSSILGGSLLSLFIHRHHDYRALGASGGVCGLLFASIFLLPGGSIHLFFIPIGIPAYLFAVLFLVFSFVMMRRGKDNIGHDAHIGGAIVGLLVATAMYPEMMTANPAMYAAVIVLSALILVVTIFDPLHLLERGLQTVRHGEQPKGSERFQRYDEARKRNAKLAEIDRLLDKVSAEGIHSLSRAEREKLDQLSKEFRDRR